MRGPPAQTLQYSHISKSRGPLPQLAGEGGAKRRMGCGPLQIFSPIARPLPRPFIDASLFSAPGSRPSALRGSSCLPQRRANALDDNRQPADDELVRKSKNAKSRALKPCIPLGILELCIRRPCVRPSASTTIFRADKRNPRNRVLWAFAWKTASVDLMISHRARDLVSALVMS